MTNKTAYITGGSRGIGKGIVQVLAQSGYDIAFTYHSQVEEATQLKQEVEALGRRCFCYQATLNESGIAEQTATQALQDLGKIDLFVSNAGLTRHNSLLDLTIEQIHFLFTLNYESYLMGAKVAANDMIARKSKGNIVFIASTRGIRAYPEDCLYGSTKAALIRATESLALELSQYGIRVNCIAPGATAIRGDFTPEELSESAFSQKIPLGRLGSPQEVGYLVEYVASPQADYMTGNTIKLDGGLILPGMPEV